MKRSLLGVYKLLLLGPRGWLLLLKAQFALQRAARVVRQRPQGELIQELGGAVDPITTGDPTDAELVEAIGLAVHRVARFGFGRHLCLVRSLAIQDLLGRRGVSGSRIRIGVRFRRGRFEAHAWVEWNGKVIGDDPVYVGLFQPFSELETLPSEFSLSASA